MTREEILQALLTGHLGSAAAVFACADALDGATTNTQHLASLIRLSVDHTRRTLYTLRDAGLVQIEHRPRGLVLRTALPANTPPLPSLPVGAAVVPDDLRGSAPTPLPPVSASAAVARLAHPDAPELPLPLPLPPLPTPPPAPANGHTDPAVAAMRQELAALKHNITDAELRTLALMFADALDLAAECNVFATWLTNASATAKDRSAKSGARKLAEIAAGRRSWFASLRDHLSRSPRLRGHRPAAAAPTVTPRPTGPSDAQLDVIWASLDQPHRDRFILMARLALERTGKIPDAPAIHRAAKREAFDYRQRKAER